MQEERPVSYQIQRIVMIGLYVVVAVVAGACLAPPGTACGDKWCSDQEVCISFNPDLDVHQLMCLAPIIGKSCRVDTDCASVAICDTGLCRFAQSCAEMLQHVPGSEDGVYSIAPGAEVPFSVVCDMTRDGGGWTLLLKANGDATFGYTASAWTDASLLNATDLTTRPGNAKYQSFLSLPVTTLRGELDGFLYTQDFASTTAQQIFAGPAAIVNGFPTFNTGAPNWSTQPNCQIFGVNTPFDYARTRFGWSANEQDDCGSNDTAIGLGLMDEDAHLHGAGYECNGYVCAPAPVDLGGNGLLWAR
jgi:hypothetical protein